VTVDAGNRAPAIELVGIDKRFGRVHANNNVNLKIERGIIHGIVGENGAGKSTLMSILYGFYEADAGEIRINGTPVRIRSSREAISHGIGMVHQHFMLVQPLSVLENVMLGAEGGPLLAVGASQIRAKLAELGRAYGLEVDPDAIVGELSVGLQQRVEILKALVRGAEILVLDEPTAVLTPAEADQLFEMLKVLKAQDKTVVFITHKLREIMRLTDRVSVMRLGEMVANFETAKTSPPELADAMVGRKVILRIEKGAAHPGEIALEARNLVVQDDRGVTRVEGMSFVLRRGEIVGIAGVAGNGQSELLEALAGIRPLSSGEILVAGRAPPLDKRNPKDIRKLGVSHVPEDRHRVGLVMPFEACESAMLGFQDDAIYGAGVLLDRRAIIADEAEKMDAFDVRPRAPLLKTANFSGGNQQKIVLAREIERTPTSCWSVSRRAASTSAR
jgi:general nucleoside transport system ATP-binding protein